MKLQAAVAMRWGGWLPIEDPFVVWSGLSRSSPIEVMPYASWAQTREDDLEIVPIKPNEGLRS